MATPVVTFSTYYDEDDENTFVALTCECGVHILIEEFIEFNRAINVVAEHNYTAHLRPDNTGLRVRR